MFSVPRAVLTTGFLFSSLVWAQIAVQVTSCPAAAFPGTSCAFPSVGAGHLVVVGFQIGPGANTSTLISSMSDNAGNTYLEAGAARSIDTASGSVADIWYARNVMAGATSITITPSTSVTGAGVVIWEVSGIDAAQPLDATAVLNSQASTSSPSGAPVTSAAASELVISLAAVSGSVTGISSGNAFTGDSVLKGAGWAHLITSSTGTYFAQWTESPAGTYASSTASFKGAVAGGGPCDLNQDGVVNVLDIQLGTDMYLGSIPCVLGNGACTSTVVGEIVTATLTGTCSVTTWVAGSHSVSLSWTASTSSNVVGYNVYRATTSGGPYTKLTTSSPVTTLSYTDTNILSGQTYYYVATAVDSSNTESAYSTQTQANVPTP